jgi:hypothetical protein
MILADTPEDAARVFRKSFPELLDMVEACHTIGSTTEELIKSVGFDIIHKPSRKLSMHYRLIHPDGTAGFMDKNLAKLAAVFSNSFGH